MVSVCCVERARRFSRSPDNGQATTTIGFLSATSAAVGSAPTQTTDTNTTTTSSQNSPLLFFVALGFGVVFTNLW
jgi:hypothetical protein